MWWTKLKERVLEPELESLRGFGGWCVRCARIAWLSIAKLRTDLGLERAATLSFVSIISVIPLGILFFSFADLLRVDSPITKYAKENVIPLVAPDFQDELARAIDEYFAKQEAFKDSLDGVVGFIAILMLIPAALAMMVTAERHLSLIWKVRSERSFLQRFAIFWVILTTSPFILIATTWVRELFRPIESIAAVSPFLGAVYHFLLPVSIGFVAFTVVYVYLPATTVRLRNAAFGGIAAAALWETTRRCFYLYVARADSLYGQLAIVPLFLIWLYLNWLIVLIGCEVAYVSQNLAAVEARAAAGRRRPLALVGFAYLEAVARAFLKGELAPTVEEFARRSLLEEDQVSAATRRLVDAGILAATAGAGAPVLAKAPETIRMNEVFDVLTPACRDLPLVAHESDSEAAIGPEDGAGAADGEVGASLALLRRSERAYRGVLEGVRLADITEREEPPAPAGAPGHG